MAISRKIQNFMEKSSWIRKMFEQGVMLKKKYGEDNVFDFSLGNPSLEPPEQFFNVLEHIVKDRSPGRHAYMPNAGYAETREAVAEYISEEHGIEIFSEHIIMTCGAGGGLNVVFKTLLDQADEVVIPTPYFVEYGFYIDNFNGVCKLVKTNENFSLCLESIENALSHKTKAVLINSPNNPTGRVYSKEAIEGLSYILDKKSRETGNVIYLVSDEPYSKIIYDGVLNPSILQAYRNSIIVTSYSKDLSLPGERIGLIAVNPDIESTDEVIKGLIFSNRTLGFVNAPAIMQRVIKSLQGKSVDIEIYKRKRDLLCGILSGLGYDFVKPEGAFYLFPRAPVNDVDFVKELQEEKILAVPGSGFGGPGFFRLSYCVNDRVIEGSAQGFSKLAKKYLG